MAALIAEYPPDGPVLDMGCGSGDLAIHIAEGGLTTLGVHFVEDAIALARAKRNALPPGVAARLRFRVADALRPPLLGSSFGALVDSGLYHLFDLEQCDPFVEDLARALRPGGRLYLHELGFRSRCTKPGRAAFGARTPSSLPHLFIPRPGRFTASSPGFAPKRLVLWACTDILGDAESDRWVLACRAGCFSGVPCYRAATYAEHRLS